MVRCRVIVSSRADKFLSELDGTLRHRIVEEISDLEDFPFSMKPHDIAKLKGRKNYYRMRVGKIRIIFRVDRNRRIVYVVKIGYREAVYE